MSGNDQINLLDMIQHIMVWQNNFLISICLSYCKWYLMELNIYQHLKLIGNINHILINILNHNEHFNMNLLISCLNRYTLVCIYMFYLMIMNNNLRTLDILQHIDYLHFKDWTSSLRIIMLVYILSSLRILMDRYKYDHSILFRDQRYYYYKHRMYRRHWLLMYN